MGMKVFVACTLCPLTFVLSPGWGRGVGEGDLRGNDKQRGSLRAP